MVNGGGVSFQVVYFDGERETEMGCVTIHPSLEFKNFQLSLSHRIGISPNQISVYLVDRKKPTSLPEVRRKLPLTGKVNFSAIAREKDCFFLVVLKGTRRNRRPKPKPKPKQGGIDFRDHFPGNKFPRLLRRIPRELYNLQFSDYESPQYNRIDPLEFADFDKKLQNLQILRKNFAMMMNSNANFNASMDLDSFAGIEESFGISTTMANNQTFCEECANAHRKGIPVPFHCCVFDVVTVGFRSSAGPIARPRLASC